MNIMKISSTGKHQRNIRSTSEMYHEDISEFSGKTIARMFLLILKYTVIARCLYTHGRYKT
jgi:hypothetical protein